jgi:hypothetical protein
MLRPGKLPTLALMMVRKGGGYPLRWLRASQVKARMNRLAMPALRKCMVMVVSGTCRVLQEGMKYCLPNLRVVALYYWGNLEKGLRGGLYVPMLWGRGGGGLGAHPEGMP